MAETRQTRLSARRAEALAGQIGAPVVIDANLDSFERNVRNLG